MRDRAQQHSDVGLSCMRIFIHVHKQAHLHPCAQTSAAFSLWAVSTCVCGDVLKYLLHCELGPKFPTSFKFCPGAPARHSGVRCTLHSVLAVSWGHCRTGLGHDPTARRMPRGMFVHGQPPCKHVQGHASMQATTCIGGHRCHVGGRVQETMFMMQVVAGNRGWFAVELNSRVPFTDPSRWAQGGRNETHTIL